MSRIIDADALKENLQNHYGVVEQDCSASKDYVEGAISGLDAVTFEIDNAPTIDAIPVEWLKAQIAPYMGDVSDLGKGAHNATIKNLIYRWQKEQGAKQ